MSIKEIDSIAINGKVFYNFVESCLVLDLTPSNMRYCVPDKELVVEGVWSTSRKMGCGEISIANLNSTTRTWKSSGLLTQQMLCSEIMFNNNQPLFDVKATSNSNVRTTTCASSRNVLTKASDDVTIKSYFEGVHELLKSKGSDAFCVNLDEVWPLVYERKDHAVRALIKDYFEGVDYTTQVPDNQVFRINGENPLGGRPSVSYYLTVSCVEHLIARA